MSIARTWGTCPEERRLPYPCDRLIPHPEDSLYRGVTIDASSQIVFRWLCQMRVAPYSYDWIDNGGRESPRALTPGLEHLAVGQDVMEIFQLADFARDQHLTIRIKSNSRTQRLFGDLAVTYLVVAQGPSNSRLLVKLVARHSPGVWGKLMKTFLPCGDLVMMRRQLLNFKQLAERRID
ncbi:MAG: hypothetical protein H0U18_01295 [Pyrinomonadaceae bacterium]|nr:hypothetical protein [Pyrinomonadaceae bacterium]